MFPLTAHSGHKPGVGGMRETYTITSFSHNYYYFVSSYPVMVVHMFDKNATTPTVHAQDMSALKCCGKDRSPCAKRAQVQL